MKMPFAAVLPVLFALNAYAHEIGTTQVRLVIHRDATWSASITTAPQSLLNKLEAVAGLPRSPALSGEGYQRAIAALLPSFASHIHLQFGGIASPARVSIEQLEQPDDPNRPAFITLVATGAVPEHATTAHWSYDLAYATYALTFTPAGGGAHSTVWIEGGDTSPPLILAKASRPPARSAVIAQYLLLGFEHILPRGLDHILFVLGIFLLTTKLRPMLAQVTAFTLAHSITLGLTMYGVVSLSPRFVEPLIALSIAYVAIENVVTIELKPWRPAVVFAFGLLHGMGFAGALRNLHLERHDFVPALVSFNAGIELAQLAVIAMAFLMTAAWWRNETWYRPRFVVPASAAIAVTGLFWTVQRIWF